MDFDELYKKLNTEQKEAVDTLEGPVMVIAGPGTGKTQILALRIANILRKHLAEPEQVLALTFSEAGVSAMKRRLGELLGREGYYVPVFTFHGFCNDIIDRYPDEFPQIGDGEHLGEIEQIELIQKIIDTSKLSLLRPFGRPDYYVRATLGAIDNLKREGVKPKEFLVLVENEEKEFLQRDDLYHKAGRYEGKMKGVHQDTRKNIEKNKEFARVYASYQNELTEGGRYDYNDMILFVLDKIEQDADFFVRVADQFSYVLVDEHQDTNNAQNRVLKFLAEEENPNIFVVGDEKQAIYRFQGASLENFLYFHKLFPGAKLISLRKNYRSGQVLLDNALAMVSNNAKRIGTVLPNITGTLESQNSPGKPEILVHEFDEESQENYYIAKRIAELIKSGTSPKEIAVLVREHRDAPAIAEALSAEGIAYVWDRPQNIAKDLWAGKMIHILRFLDDVGNDEKLLAVLHVDILGVPPIDVYNLFARTGARQAKAGPDPAFGRMEHNESEHLRRVYILLSDWHTQIHNNPPVSVFEQIVREAGFMGNNDMRALQGLKGLFRIIQRYSIENPRATLSDLLSYLELVEQHNIRLKMHTQAANLAAPRIMTIHSTKGLEFDYVFIPRLHDAHWGGRKKSQLLKLPAVASYDSPEDRYEGERRTFFVGLTRARYAAYVSFASVTEDGKNQTPSIFLGELGTKTTQRKEEVPIFSESVPNTSSPKEEMTAWVQDLFSRRGFSVTALNNYLECPWKYFYRNLLQVPSAPSKQQLYGIAVHDALHHFFTQAQAGPGPAWRALVGEFEKSLKKQVLSERDFEEILKRGKTSLAAWYEHHKDTWNYNTKNELSISIPFAPDLRLTGKIDKIELDGRKAIVVDYKTGKSKTRGEIEGTTKNSTGALKRQLVFYKLLLDESKQHPYTMVAGQLDFVEPDAKGNLHKEQFEISEAEVRLLKKEIERVAQEIKTLKFWDTRCDNKTCEWCALRG